MLELGGIGWVGLAMAIVAAWFAIKAVKFFFKVLWWIAVLVGACWFLAPTLGLPWPF